VTRQVLLWGLPQDQDLNAVRGELSRRDVPHLLLDQREAHRMHLDLCANHVSGRLRLGAQRIDLDDVGAIFVRPRDIREVLRDRGDMPGTQSHAQAMAVERGLFVWIDLANALVINRPSAMASKGFKSRHAQTIRQYGFEIPPALVTSAPEDARAFIAEHGQVIYQSVSGQHSIVSRVDAVQFEQIDGVANCPTHFQAHISGVDWRVHVIGDAVHACEIRCRTDHCRMSHVQGEAIELSAAALPPSIEMRCHALAQHLNLPLAGIDLRRTDSDAWYCIEVNTAPALTYYERATGQRLTAAVAQLLIDGSRSEPT
jgi:glutathione synthase/RimK-type ligase-like ATP-grasp enzyme